MLNCWRVNESCTVDITELLIQKLSAVFVTKSLLELGGDECDNLNFMNYKIDSFKIRNNSWIFRNLLLQLIKFEFSSYAIHTHGNDGQITPHGRRWIN